MQQNDVIQVEVAYALPDKQQIVSLEVERGCTVYEAAERSGIVSFFPEIELEKADMGIFGKAVPKPKQREIQAGERVEIYRPLIADPKEVRKQRAAKVKARKAQ